MPFRELDFWLVDSLIIPASLHNVDGTFVHMNAAAERAANVTSDDLRGRSLTYLVVPEQRPHVEDLFRSAVERGEPNDFETSFVDGAGHLRTARAQHLPLRKGDEIVGVLILAWGVLSPSEPGELLSPPRLTPRQVEVLSLIAAGFSTEEAAKRLTLSADTIRNHLRNAFRELRAHNRLEAIVAARRLGLLRPPVLGSPGRQ